MPPRGRAHGWRCCLWLHFVVNVQHRRRGFTDRSPSAAVRKRQPWTARIRALLHNQPSYDGCPQKAWRQIIHQKKGKAFMRRNSFIEMAKLHNLSGRITYISSHARQEYLYEVYATEPDRAFWRELAKCNQEEFEKSGTNGKCIEARELMIALPESFILCRKRRLFPVRGKTMQNRKMQRKNRGRCKI